MLLTIAIPTFNRYALLREQMQKLVPWVASFEHKVEILVLDNASADGTQAFMEDEARIHGFVRYIRNPENLGFDGNTIKCIENAQGVYVALLSDDDRYTDETFPVLLPLLESQRFSLVCLNYYGFREIESEPSVNYVEAQDKCFDPGTGIFQHPSVGHLSAFVYKTTLAQSCLPKVIRYVGTRYLYVALGIYVANHAASFFAGQRILATRIPEKVEWGFFDVCVISAVRFYRDAVEDGVFTTQQLVQREASIIRALPKHLIREIGVNGYQPIKAQLDTVNLLFGGYTRYRVTCAPLIALGKLSLVRLLYKNIYYVVRSMKDRR